MTSWVYVQSEPQCFTVGFYDPQGKWHGDSDHSTREQAAARVAYLSAGQLIHKVNDLENRLIDLENAARLAENVRIFGSDK